MYKWILVVENPNTNLQGFSTSNYMPLQDGCTNIANLLNCKVKSYENVSINDADIFYLSQYNPNYFTKQIKFAEKLKNNNKKIILHFSADQRFTFNHSLYSKDGSLYTELCSFADIIMSEGSLKYQTYGRYQKKVIPLAEPMSDNFTLDKVKPKWDFFICCTQGHLESGFSIELAIYLKQELPHLKIACAVDPVTIQYISIKYPSIDFLNTENYKDFIPILQSSKVLITIDRRVTGGRTVCWGVYAKIPVISSETFLFSELYPDLCFNYIDFDDLVKKCKLAIDSPQPLVDKAISLSIRHRFSNWYKTLLEKLNYG